MSPICSILTLTIWKYRGSDIEDSGIYDGEILNRLKWNDTVNEWKSAEFIDIDKSLLVDRHSLPVIAKETLPVKEIIHTPVGETVLDMGQNFSGWIVFQNHQPSGTKLHFEFGEVLQNDNFYNDNYRSAKGGFTYISNGKTELVRPHFTYLPLPSSGGISGLAIRCQSWCNNYLGALEQSAGRWQHQWYCMNEISWESQKKWRKMQLSRSRD